MSTTKPAAELTKNDEFAQFDAIIAATNPAGYLRPILSGIRDSVRAAIRNDFGFIQFDSWRREREAAELGQAIAAREKTLRELSCAIDDRRRELARLTREFETISGDAATIGRIGAERAATLRRALA